MGRRNLPYSGLQRQIVDVISTLNGVGIGRNDRVAIVMPNGPEMAVLSIAVMAGAAAAPLNPEYRKAEYAFYLAKLRPRLLIAPAGQSSPALAAAAELNIPVMELKVPRDAPAGTFTLNSDIKPAVAANPGQSTLHDSALVLHTSGTTAAPRTVALTQRNLSASADNLISSLALGSDDICLNVLPMYHIGGLIDVLAAPLIAGGTVICNSGFASPAFFRAVDQFRPTWSQAVPAMLREITANIDANRDIVDASRLRFMRSVSAPLPEAQMREFEQHFGIPVIEIYGMTETAGVITSNPLPEAPRKARSVGLPVGQDVAIVDENGKARDIGMTGEIVVRGENVMAGYENEADNEPTGSFFGPWFRTGDQGHFDEDGYLYLTGRTKEIINRGGEKVSPFEIDEILLNHPQIVDAAAFAVPHETLGEDVAVVAVARDGAALTKQDIAEYLKPRLIYFKQPRTIRIVAEIPRTRGGKIQRKGLVDLLDRPDTPDFERPTDRASDETADGDETAVTKRLAEMWAAILDIDVVGLQDDFFDLGGDSLKAETFINELEERSGHIIYVSALFDAPTLAEFEAYLRREYSDLVAGLLGQVVSSAPQTRARLTEDQISDFRQSVMPVSRRQAPRGGRNRAAIFVLGTPRSGSTLLRAILGGHPALFAPPELYLLSFNDLAERDAWFGGSQRYIKEGNIRCLMQVMNSDVEEAESRMKMLEEQALPVQDYFRLLQDEIGDRILVDKTPFYAMHMDSLERMEDQFEDALYIHLARHPYGMIRSFEEARLDQLWYPRIATPEAVTHTPWPYDAIQLAELIWLTLHENIRAFLKQVPDRRQCRMTFEDLVSDPSASVSRLCGFLGIEFVPDMIDPYNDRRQRMTDGLHAQSRMIGDMKFHRHSGIDASAAELWKSAYGEDFLSEPTLALARSFGYEETIASLAGRMEFAI